MNKNFGRIRFLGRRFDDPTLAGNGYTFLGKATHPKYTGQFDAFIKFFDIPRQKRAMANELMAYHLGHKFNLPVAETFPCYCEPEQVKGRLPWLPANDHDAAHLCVASLAVTGFEYRLRREPIQSFERRLTGWSYAPLAALFDELGFNCDRHQNNFLVIDERQLVLIDHAELFCGSSWTTEMLHKAQRAPSPGNYLARVILDSDNAIAKRRLAQSAEEMVYKSQFSLKDFPDAFFDVANAVKVNMDEIQAIIEFLNARRSNLPALLKAQQMIERQLAARTS